MTTQLTRTEARPTAHPAAAARYWFTWRRLAVPLELLTLGAGYAAPSVIRLALPAAKNAAFSHAAELYHSEQRVRLNVEPYLNHLVSSHPVLAGLTGYYYGTLHFILTPLVLAWLYLRRPANFPRLRSALVISTIGANIVFWTWPVAPPRFAVPGMNDLLVTRDILGSADPHGVTSAVNLYAAMPSLHVCWATWCAVAVVTAARSRWRYLAWLYPAATTFVVLASANHFVLDCIGGLAIALLGLAATRMRQLKRPAPQPETRTVPAPPAGAVPATRLELVSGGGGPPAGRKRGWEYRPGGP
jgi:PAP2 superfamily